MRSLSRVSKADIERSVERLSVPKTVVVVERDPVFNNYSTDKTFVVSLRSNSATPKRKSKSPNQQNQHQRLASGASTNSQKHFFLMKGDDAKNRSTVELMKTYLGQKYLNAVVSQAEKFTEECRFTPDLKLTQNYNRQVNPRPSR